MSRQVKLFIAAAVATLAGAAAWHTYQVSAQQAPAARDITDFNTPAMGISFRQIGSSDVTLPTLPTGKGAISRDTALAIAGRHSMADMDPRRIANVQYIVHYGMFTDSQLHQVGTQNLAFVNRPVWVVRYFGSGVNIPNDGPIHSKPTYSHEVTVVIDAATGEHLETYIG